MTVNNKGTGNKMHFKRFWKCKQVIVNKIGINHPIVDEPTHSTVRKKTDFHTTANIQRK